METNEFWKPIKGYEGLYEVSSFGNVKSLSRNIKITNRWGHDTIRLSKEKTPKKQTSNNGYLRVFLSKDNIIKPYSAHRLVAIAFIDNPENKPQVNHKDGNKLNNSIDNLEWNTQSENIKHAFKTGLLKVDSGSNDSQSKKVYMYTVSNYLVKTFGSLCEADRNGYPRTCVKRACDNNTLYKNHKFSLHGRS